MQGEAIRKDEWTADGERNKKDCAKQEQSFLSQTTLVTNPDQGLCLVPLHALSQL